MAWAMAYTASTGGAWRAVVGGEARARAGSKQGQKREQEQSSGAKPYPQKAQAPPAGA